MSKATKKHELTPDEYATWIGARVTKHTKNPFKSTLRINTVKGTMAHPITGRLAFTFQEDDSIVECRVVRRLEKNENTYFDNE